MYSKLGSTISFLEFLSDFLKAQNNKKSAKVEKPVMSTALVKNHIACGELITCLLKYLYCNVIC